MTKLFESTRKLLKKHALMFMSDLLTNLHERINKELHPEDYLTAFKFFSEKEIKPSSKKPIIDTAIETRYFNSPEERMAFWRGRSALPTSVSKEDLAKADDIRNKFRNAYLNTKFAPTSKDIDSSLTAISFFKNIENKSKLIESAIETARFESPSEWLSSTIEETSAKDQKPLRKMTRSEWSDKKREDYQKRYGKVAPLPTASELNKLEFVDYNETRSLEEVLEEQRVENVKKVFISDLTREIKNTLGNDVNVTIKKDE